ncbi:MAG: CHASE2 domain-containing protein, partial [Sphingomonas sp.]
MTGSNSTPDPPRRPVRVRLAGLAAALLAALLFGWIGAEGTTRALFDRYQRLAPAPARGDAVRVVLIDPESLRAVGPWPWPRYAIARLTEEIAARGAIAIGFDMIFPDPDRLNPDRVAALYPEMPVAARDAMLAAPSQDAVLAEVIGAHPVVLARVGIDGDAMDFAAGAQTDPAKLPVSATFAAPLPPGVQAYPGALANIPDLDEVGAGQALINGAPDRDGVIRRVPLVARVAGAPTPGFALELARVATASETIAPIVAGDRLRSVDVAGRRVPVDADGRMRLRFGPLPAGAVASAALLLQRGWRPDAFRGRIVIVGLGAAGTADVVTTPRDRETYGTFVQAQAVNAILGGGALLRPWWAGAAEWTAAALLAALAILLLPRLRGAAIGLAPALAVVATLGGSFVAFARGNLLLDPLRPL